jgi:hypothetical protein
MAAGLWKKKLVLSLYLLACLAAALIAVWLGWRSIAW